MAGRSATWEREGARNLSRHCGQWLRVPEALSARGDDALDRARRFAAHALGQVRRLRSERGRGRYSLWTGDLGVALYAAECLDGGSVYPFFDLRE